MDRPNFISERGAKSLIQVGPEDGSGLIGTDDRGYRHFAIHRLEELDLAQRSDQFGKLDLARARGCRKPSPYLGKLLWPPDSMWVWAVPTVDEPRTP